MELFRFLSLFLRKLTVYCFALYDASHTIVGLLFFTPHTVVLCDFHVFFALHVLLEISQKCVGVCLLNSVDSQIWSTF